MKCQSFGCLRAVLMVLSGLMLWTLPVAAQHSHLYVGAVSPNPGEPLWFENAYAWDTNSWGGYTKYPACIYMEANEPVLYPGLYQSAISFVSDPATIYTGGPSPYAASLGTYIQLKFISLEGPKGGELSIWSEIEDPEHPSLMFTVPVGTTNGTQMFNLSEGDPSDPSADPYGHIHGRRFTLNKPGLYTVGLQLVDTSSNGPDGGPVQSASTNSYFYLQAGLCIDNVFRTNNVTVVRFGLTGFIDYYFEASPTVDGTNWTTIYKEPGAPHSDLHWLTDTNATNATRFYRIRPVPVEF